MAAGQTLLEVDTSAEAPGARSSLANPRRVLPVLLWVAGLTAIPSGIALRWLVPNAWDPLWARALICLSCLGLAEAIRRDARRATVQQAVRVLAIIAAAWVVTLVWGNGFPPGASSGVLPLLGMCLLGFPTIREGIRFTLFMSVLLAIAGWASPGHELHAAGLVVSCLTLGSVLALATAHRAAMADRLRSARDDLERTVADRTAELRAEVRTRRKAEARAVQASETKSRFLANMSHELRTPLNAIKGYAELCTEVMHDHHEGAEVPRDDLLTDLGRVTTAADRLLALVNDVLDLARIEAGMMEMHPEPTDVAALVHRMGDELQPLVAAQGNRLERHLDALPPTIEVDAHRLHQVLVNLLGNAAKFTEGGTITLGGTLDKGAVELTVEDTGIGIPASALPHLFDRFTMVDDSSTKQHDGTGLGLALSRDLARRMGGELTARSQEGLGSVFTVRLPLAAPQTTPMPARPSPPAPA